MITANSTSPDSTAPPLRTVEQVIDDMPRPGLSRAGWIALNLGFFLGLYEAAIIAIALSSIERGLGTDASGLAIPIALTFVGFAAGAYVVGMLADRKGRQFGLRLTFTILAIGALACAVAWNVPSLAVGRLIVGCGMGAVLAVVTLYIGEVSPRNRRGLQTALFALTATILIAVTTFASLPLLSALPQQAWRILLGLPVVGLFVVAFVNKRDLVESPRWLLERGHIAEAVRIVVQLDSHARRGAPSATAAEIDPSTRQDASTTEVAIKPIEILRGRRDLVRRLVIIAAVMLFYYVAFGGLTTFLVPFLTATGIAEDRALFIVAVSRVAGVFASVVILIVIERVERRILIAGSMTLFGAGIALIMLGLGEGPALVGTILAGLSTGLVAPAVYTFVAEIFPTEVRGTATSIADGIGRLGGVIAPFTFLPLLLAGGALAAGGLSIGLILIALLLVVFGLRVNTKGRSLDEISNN